MGHEKAGVITAVVTRMWPKDIRIAFVLVAGAVAAAPVTAQDFALGPAEIADSAPLSRAMPRLAHQVLERYRAPNGVDSLDNTFRLQLLERVAGDRPGDQPWQWEDRER